MQNEFREAVSPVAVTSAGRQQPRRFKTYHQGSKARRVDFNVARAPLASSALISRSNASMFCVCVLRLKTKGLVALMSCINASRRGACFFCL